MRVSFVLSALALALALLGCNRTNCAANENWRKAVEATLQVGPSEAQYVLRLTNYSNKFDVCFLEHRLPSNGAPIGFIVTDSFGSIKAELITDLPPLHPAIVELRAGERIDLPINMSSIASNPKVGDRIGFGAPFIVCRELKNGRAWPVVLEPGEVAWIDQTWIMRSDTTLVESYHSRYEAPGTKR